MDNTPVQPSLFRASWQRLRRTIHGHPWQTAIVVVCLLALSVGFWWLHRRWQTQTLFHQADQAVRAYEFDQARDLLAQLLTRHPHDAKVHFLLGQLGRRGGDYAMAENYLLKAQELGWPKDEISLEYLLLRVQRGDRSLLPQVQGLVGKGLAADPLILEALIQIHVQDYEFTAALANVEHYLQLDETNPKIWLARGYIREKQFQFGAAIKDYRHALALFPDNMEVREKLAEALLITGPPGEALEQFQWLADQGTPTPAVLLGLAKSYRQLGQLEKAREYLDQLLRQLPADFPGWHERGKLALDEEKPAEAEMFLAKAVQLAPHDRNTHYNLAQALQRLGRSQDAQKHLDEYHRLDADLKKLNDLTREVLRQPGDASLRYEVGILFMRTGEEEEGLRWLGQALQRDPRHRPTHAFLADFFEKKGNHLLAQQHRRVVALDQK